MRRVVSRGPLRGLTLIELVLSLGLASILMLALFQLLETSLSVWRRGETRRALLEQSSIIGELLSADLRHLDGSSRSDLLAEWAPFDTDGDGAVESYWPRLRAVRRATPAEIQRLQVGREKPVNDVGLIEVVWVALPATKDKKDAVLRDTAVLWRGERLVGDTESESFFDNRYFGATNEPPYTTIDEVASGLLWLDFTFATQTSVVRDGWKKGTALRDVATCWDAWSRERPPVGWHPWNELSPGVPRVGDRPVLPRRVRVELELERDADRLRRPRIESTLSLTETSISVDSGDLLPQNPGAFVKIGAEWMEVVSVDGDRVAVKRAQRGTRPLTHKEGAMVHWGLRSVREVPIALYRDDWNIR